LVATSIKIADEFVVSADRDTVWQNVTDPYVVVSCVPGARITGGTVDEGLDGCVQVALGPTAVEFAGKLMPTFDDDSHVGKVIARGADASGRTKAQGEMAFRVEATPAGETQVTLTGSISMNGALSGFLRSGGTHIARAMIADFAVAFSKRCAPGTEAETATVEEPNRLRAGRLVLMMLAGMWASSVQWLRRVGRSVRERAAGRKSDSPAIRALQNRKTSSPESGSDGP
jgi:carbon monoxide dehydrogenase subunit G